MRKLFSIPLVFLFLASCIGLLLRWNFVFPLEWLQYPHWLHAHSHMMFLGWIFNALMMAYLYNYKLLSDRRYKAILLCIQLLLVGMLISFPIQGYGFISIAISAFHTLSVWIFAFLFFRDMRKRAEPSMWFAKGSLILFLVSSLGIFAVGAISAIGMGQTKWYYLAVYYYLHFQYNGVFIFGLLSLLLKLLEDRNVLFDRASVYKAGFILFIAIFPTYFLSTLWSEPGILFNIVGMTGALLQLLFIFRVSKSLFKIKFRVSPNAKALMGISVTAFILKCLLQLLSAHPEIARMAFEVRPFVIAYLHLVLIGVITFFLLGWYIENNLLKTSWYSVVLLIFGFSASELAMVGGNISCFSSWASGQTAGLLFIFSFMLVLAIFLISLQTMYSRE